MSYLEVIVKIISDNNVIYEILKDIVVPIVISGIPIFIAYRTFKNEVMNLESTIKSQNMIEKTKIEYDILKDRKIEIFSIYSKLVSNVEDYILSRTFELNYLNQKEEMENILRVAQSSNITQAEYTNFELLLEKITNEYNRYVKESSEILKRILLCDVEILLVFNSKVEDQEKILLSISDLFQNIKELENSLREEQLMKTLDNYYSAKRNTTSIVQEYIRKLDRTFKESKNLSI